MLSRVVIPELRFRRKISEAEFVSEVTKLEASEPNTKRVPSPLSPGNELPLFATVPNVFLLERVISLKVCADTSEAVIKEKKQIANARSSVSFIEVLN